MTTKEHLLLAHQVFKESVAFDSIVVDATCGNGHDTLLLATLVPKGRVFAIDLQETAIDQAKKRLASYSNPNSLAPVTFILGSHADLASYINETPDLIVYNLGYLPRGNKSLITKADSTIQSLREATQLLRENGTICITTYSEHPGGQEEEDAVLNFAQKLDNKRFLVRHTRWLNYHKSPTVLIIKKLPTT